MLTTYARGAAWSLGSGDRETHDGWGLRWGCRIGEVDAGRAEAGGG